MEFCDYLKKTRSFYGLTQAELAVKLGYAQTTVSDIENKRKHASEKFKAALIRHFPRTDEFERFLYERGFIK
ncbi:helix-turn-helix transcriptional regulator [Lysinibacillus fusiformis]|uniref:helix-turn-helix transcriptional regulator n=1 Tax=Lysinibacillus fusiformis TaxID=28031 RepID=UPI003D075FFB